MPAVSRLVQHSLNSISGTPGQSGSSTNHSCMVWVPCMLINVAAAAPTCERGWCATGWYTSLTQAHSRKIFSHPRGATKIVGILGPTVEHKSMGSEAPDPQPRRHLSGDADRHLPVAVGRTPPTFFGCHNSVRDGVSPQDQLRRTWQPPLTARTPSVVERGKGMVEKNGPRP